MILTTFFSLFRRNKNVLPPASISTEIDEAKQSKCIRISELGLTSSPIDEEFANSPEIIDELRRLMAPKKYYPDDIHDVL